MCIRPRYSGPVYHTELEEIFTKCKETNEKNDTDEHYRSSNPPHDDDYQKAEHRGQSKKSVKQRSPSSSSSFICEREAQTK